ncbi:sarcosine oxidase subunit gamma [Planosporangium flavigriseum]|uniref:Sarcosine oxidase subunit gamma n=1 Tax=Planosporangium flavigriseum TaxID=373681 RepID=A0A8J3LNV4_9ACTN|nr:sarcosine oxidase subunit gamma family protein [Planosporangium flavigriseum]NJC66166.1 sarcosine oxidase subunit gamma [Planosporangium flavigriseum]GIG75142.1 sarcosine oxidase subunit gamma [Planosporangium flavigriseum]
MAEQTLLRQSPLAFAADRLAEVTRATGGAVYIAELPFLTQLNLRLDPKGPAAEAGALELGVPLPTGPGAATSGPAGSDELTVVWLGPDEWLVIGPPGTESDLAARLRSAIGDEHAAVVDVSAQRTTLELSGPRARDLLASGCALDLHPRVFGEGASAQTLLARAQVILVGRRDGAFRVLVRASFAAYLVDWLIDASVEYRVTR